MNTVKRASAVAILTGLMSTAQAIPYDPGLLNFSATDQDMWGSGDSVAPVTANFSTNWSSSSTVGGITGSARTLITPAIPAYDVYVDDWHPPVVHDHGYGEWHSSYGIPYWEWHSDTETHAGYSESHYVGTTPGVDAVYADTRTGVEAVLSTSGSVGVTSNLGFNGGTIDASVAYGTNLVLPDDIVVGEYFNFNPTSAIGDVSLDTQFPILAGEVTATLSARIDATTTGCFIGTGCSTSSGSLLSIVPTDIDILKINTDDLPNDTMSVFGLDDLAFDATRGKVYADLVLIPSPPFITPVVTLPGLQPPVAAGINLGDITLDYPDFTTSGGLTSSGTVDNIVRINADLDAAATLAGTAPILGAVAYAGPLTFRGDLIDIDVGPTMDLSQNFELTPTLMLDLVFDHPVLNELGDQISFWSGALSDIPSFALHDNHRVQATPTYWLAAMLENQTSLDFDLTFSLDVLKGSITALGVNLGSVILEDQDYPIALGSEDVFNDIFAFGGFQRITANPFILATRSGGGSVTNVPEPATLMLFAIGLVGVGMSARRRRG